MNKKKIIILIITIIVVIFLIYVFFIKTNEPKKVTNTVKHEIAEELYKQAEVENCNGVVTFDKETNIKEMTDEVIIYLIFNQMKKDKLLTDKINLDDYQTIAKKVLGNKAWPSKINNYIYDGYKYTLNEDIITRTKTNCGNKKYTSKLYGYSNKDDKLEIDIAVVYIQNKKVYDLNDKEIGDYSKENINKILDKGTIQVYSYIYNNGSYSLESIGSK